MRKPLLKDLPVPNAKENLLKTGFKSIFKFVRHLGLRKAHKKLRNIQLFQRNKLNQFQNLNFCNKHFKVLIWKVVKNVEGILIANEYQNMNKSARELTRKRQAPNLQRHSRSKSRSNKPKIIQ
jgi:hypothetical protein